MKRLSVWIFLFLALPLWTGCGVFRGGDPEQWSGADLVEEEAWQEAVAELQRQQALAPSQPYWPFRVGELAAQSGRSEEAESAWREALEADGSYAPALSYLTRKLYEEDRHLEAIEMLEEVCASGAGCREELLAALALHYEAIGEQERAESLVQPYRSHGDHWNRIGAAITFLTLQGEDFREAPRLAERAFAANSESAANCNNFGIAMLQEGRPGEARKYFLRARELQPSRPGPLYNLAIVEKFYFFDDAAAADYFSQFRALSDDDPDGLGEVFGEEPSGQSEAREDE